jgi:hypothetical protein
VDAGEGNEEEGRVGNFMAAGSLAHAAQPASASANVECRVDKGPGSGRGANALTQRARLL